MVSHDGADEEYEEEGHTRLDIAAARKEGEERVERGDDEKRRKDGTLSVLALWMAGIVLKPARYLPTPSSKNGGMRRKRQHRPTTTGNLQPSAGSARSLPPFYPPSLSAGSSPCIAGNSHRNTLNSSLAGLVNDTRTELANSREDPVHPLRTSKCFIELLHRVAAELFGTTLERQGRTRGGRECAVERGEGRE